MNLLQAPGPTSAGSAEEISRIPGRWLRLARAAWVTITILSVTLFVASLPAYYDQLRTACTGDACISHQLTPEGMQALRELGLSAGFYAAYSLALGVLFASVCLAVAAVVFWRASRERVALIGASMLVLFGVVFPEIPRALAQQPLWHWPVSVLGFLGFVSAALFINLFPGGRFVPRWTLWATLVWIVAIGQGIFFPGSTDLSWVSLLNTLGFVGAASASLSALVYRYLRKAHQVQRQQVKWVVFGIVAGLGGVVSVALLGVVFPTPGPPGLFDTLGVRLAQTFMLLLVPLSIGIAILRYRLWDIDFIINRSLVYGALTASVVGLYVLVVGGLGVLLRVQGNLLVSILAAGLVAMLFQPLRARLQRAVNRLMYGERDDPYAVLSGLGERLEATLAPKAVLPTVVETVVQALKVPHAEVLLQREDGFETAAQHGMPSGEPLVLPLVYQNETFGRLVISPRAKDESFTPADRRLLEDLTRQAGVAAYTVRLTADLQRSRERLVTAREEERRRLRRDLHDGIGPQLAALTLKIETARNRLGGDPTARDLLSDLAERARATVADVRRSVHALRPPALDELGLVPALRETAAQYSQNGLQVHVRAPDELPPLPAAVEVAAYRIAQEALTNVVRHAGARVCTVCFRLDKDAGLLRLEVEDDGRGIGWDGHHGVGLSSMRERAEELSGECVLETAPGSGTRVRASLPIQDALQRTKTRRLKPDA
jgi:signal transduction histidine kinase